MNWEAIAAVGEIIGAAGVVVSIVYLSIQIKANTRATRGSASYEAAHSWAQTNEQSGQLPDEMLALLHNCLRPDFMGDKLSDVDYMRFSLVYRSILQKLEGQYFLYKNGLMDADLWAQRRAIGNGMIKTPFMRAWWENECAIRTFSEPFVHAIETAPTSIDPARVNRRIST